ncbi:MAG: tRNA dimethylallyltransferase, partial [bacterium]|nr:tRNA dimethylallyltransferase [bacterium]
DRKDLYDRINDRVIKMIDSGWLDEVKRLQGTEWESFIQKKRLIGYNELFDYLNAKNDLTSTVKIIQCRTRNYAKRQYTFWRMIAKSLAQDMLSTDRRSKIESVDLTFMDLDLYIKQLSSQLTRVIN